MSIPRWLLFLVAAWVIAFGVFRIVVALRRRPAEGQGPNFMRRGLYARAPRTHMLFGALYVLLGGFLIATGFGWAPVLDIAACAGAREDSTRRPDSRNAIPVSPAPSAPRPSDSASGK